MRLVGLAAAAVTSSFILAACGTTEADQPGAVAPVPPVAELSPEEVADLEDGESGEIVETPGVTGETVNITYRWWGGQNREERQLAAIALFEERNPGITVTPFPVSFDGYYDVLGVEMVAGTAPDVFTLDRSWPIELGLGGGLLPISGTTVDLSNFSPAVLETATVNGTVYAVPNGGNATGLIVNTDLFEEAGIDLPDDETWTWDDFVAISEQLSANLPAGSFGAELRPWDFINAYVTQRNGVGLFNSDGSIAADEATLADFFDLMHTLTSGGGAPSAAETTELFAAGPDETLMGTGQSAMIFAPSNMIAAYQAANNANLVLMRIPGETEFAHVGTTVLPSQFFAISANTAHADAALAFVNFLVNDPDAGEILGVDRGNPVNSVIAAQIAPSLPPIAQEQVYFMDRIAASALPTIPQPAGAGEVQPITTLAMQTVVFNQASSADAAAAWLAQMQTALNDAR